MELREALKMLRSEAKMTQTELASEVYVSFSTVNRWENKGTQPNKMQYKALIELSKKKHASLRCVDALTACFLEAYANGKEDGELVKHAWDRTKQNNRALFSSEQFMETIDNIDVAIIGQRFFSDDPTDCEIFYRNNYFLKALGYTRETFKEKLVQDPFFAITPESRAALFAQLRELLSNEKKLGEFNPIVKAVRKDGSVCWLEIKGASLTKCAYGQELFTSCRDVSQRVDAERRCQEETWIHNNSLQVVYASIHCDLTDKTVLCHCSLPLMLGKQYEGESLGQLIAEIANAAPEGTERSRYLAAFSPDALLSAYERGGVCGNAILYNKHAHRWLRHEYIVQKNPVNENIQALIYVFDMQKQILSEKMLDIMLSRHFDFVGLIDIEERTIEPFFMRMGSNAPKISGRWNYSALCVEKMAQFACPNTRAKELQAVSIETVRQRLEKTRLYSTALHVKGRYGKISEKKVSFTYFDENRKMIIITQQNMPYMTLF